MKKKIFALITAFVMLAVPLSVYAGAYEKAGYRITDSVSADNPFPKGAGGSENFRIPAFKVLSDGSLLAAADARYETLGDGGGLDTIIAVSEDGGLNWKQNYAIHYPDSEGYAGNAATTCIDPVIAEGADGTVYIMADMNPTGVTTAGGFMNPGRGTGYTLIDGTDRAALTDNYAQVNDNPADYPYPYYLGDSENGFAPVLRYEDNSETGWVLDGWWNIYKTDENGENIPLYQTQVNSDREVQQNVFYKDSVLHVYNTGYMFMVSSEDKGLTWEPRILNSQIKRADETALLVSPGKGTLTSDGTVLIPFYSWETGKEPLTQSVSFIWSSDNGDTWHRTEDAPCTNGVDWCSESEIVEIYNGVLRTFVRNGTGRLCYIDASWDSDKGNYSWSEPVVTDVKVCSSCNLTASTYSGTTDGKKTVFVASPTGKQRSDGKIFTFHVEEDNSMTPVYAYRINCGPFAYSCMDELPDGTVGILYEEASGALKYKNITVEKLTAHGMNFEIYLITALSFLAAAVLTVLIILSVRKIIKIRKKKL